MALGLQISETMSGTLTLHGGTPQPFAFAIRAFTTQLFRFSVPRPFRGQLQLGEMRLPCHGELTLRLSGPQYRVAFEHPQWGALEAIGRKRYGQGGLIRSLITCPLTIYREGDAVGSAEVVYRDSILLFVFRALRLVPEARAFEGHGGAGA